MKTLKLIILLLSLWIVGGTIYCVNRDSGSGKQTTNYPTPFRYQYEDGQIVYPEYSGEDTLIVNDAKGLNAAMQKVHDNLEMYPYGDAQYDSLFHQYCKVFIECRYEGRECPNYNNCNGHIEKYVQPIDYKLAIYNDTMWLYTTDNKLVGRIITHYDSPLDSLIIADNQ